MSPARRRKRRSRLLGLLLLVVLLEAALQLAGPLVQRAMARRDGPASPDAPLTVLCVGDSNTYGLNLPRIYAYPAFLEASLSTRYSRPVTVVNRGVPGQNTAQVTRGLAQDLQDVRPDIVLLLAGINDTWNTDQEDGGAWRWVGRLKLVRLTRVLMAGVTSASDFSIATDDAGEIVVDRGEGARRVNAGTSMLATRQGPALQAAVQRGLREAVELCRDFGALPVLMTYVEYQQHFAAVNAAIRDLARADGLLLVDHEQAFTGHFAQHGYGPLMFNDHHPNQQGYRLMAAGIVGVLTEAGLAPAQAGAGPAARPAAEPPSLPTLVQAGRHAVLVSGPSGWAWLALISEAPDGPEDGFDLGSVRVPLKPGSLLALSRHEPTFSGRFEQGPVRIPVPAAIRRAANGPLALCVLLLRDVPWSEETSAPAIAGLGGPFAIPD